MSRLRGKLLPKEFVRPVERNWFVFAVDVLLPYSEGGTPPGAKDCWDWLNCNALFWFGFIWNIEI